jgi:hypothetical protein
MSLEKTSAGVILVHNLQLWRSSICIMPFVFVSHADEDKQRIAPHLRRLLAAGLPLWIDRTHELGPEFDEQGRIRLGEAWPSSISRALDDCGCVLLFWSEHAVQPEKAVLRREANTGLRENKLIQVTLSAGVMQKVHEVFSELQAEALEKLQTPDELERGYRRLESAIRGKLAAWKRRTRDMVHDVPVSLLPFVVDRQPQMDSMCRDLVGQVRRLRSPEASSSPWMKPVYVLFGRNVDCPSRLSERLGRVDGPEVCRNQGHAAWLAWDDEILIRWPSERSAPPGRVGERFSAALDRHEGRLDRPRCVVAHIEHVRANEHDFVHNWLEFWHRFFRSRPELPLIPVLTVDPTTSDSFFRAHRLRRIARRLQTWAPGAEAGRLAIRPILLDQLSHISYEDAQAWARKYFASSPVRLAADAFVDETFAFGRVTMPLANFAKEVRGCAWYNDLAC